jgi:YhcH/YjgK/YiaL family protein
LIIDTLNNATMYYALGPRLERALRFLQVLDPAQVTLGRHEIAGEQVYALVQEYDSKPLEEGFWEAHRSYLDVQYVASGVERIGYAALGSLQAGEYDAEKDFVKLEGEGQLITVPAGTFVILAPQDAHMPGMAADGPEPVMKVVVKVQV